MNDPYPPPQFIDVPPDVEKSSTEPPAAAADLRPTPEMIVATQRYFITQREDLLQQIAMIESFLGFANESGSLAARIAKIEAFLGLKG